MNRCPLLLALLASFLVDFSACPARADVTEVDLALVLAVDISQSMDEEEQVLIAALEAMDEDDGGGDDGDRSGSNSGPGKS